MSWRSEKLYHSCHPTWLPCKPFIGILTYCNLKTFEFCRTGDSRRNEKTWTWTCEIPWCQGLFCHLWTFSENKIHVDLLLWCDNAIVVVCSSGWDIWHGETCGPIQDLTPRPHKQVNLTDVILFCAVWPLVSLSLSLSPSLPLSLSPSPSLPPSLFKYLIYNFVQCILIHYFCYPDCTLSAWHYTSIKFHLFVINNAYESTMLLMTQIGIKKYGAWKICHRSALGLTDLVHSLHQCFILVFDQIPWGESYLF